MKHFKCIRRIRKIEKIKSKFKKKENPAYDQCAKTFDQMCLDKLKELGLSTAKEWTSALGYTHSNSLVRVINRVLKKHPEKLKVYKDKRPYRYEAL